MLRTRKRSRGEGNREREGMRYKQGKERGQTERSTTIMLVVVVLLVLDVHGAIGDQSAREGPVDEHGSVCERRRVMPCVCG